MLFQIKHNNNVKNIYTISGNNVKLSGKSCVDTNCPEQHQISIISLTKLGLFPVSVNQL